MSNEYADGERARRGSIKRFMLRAIKFHPRSDFWGQCQTRQKYLQAGAGAGWSQPSVLALDLASPPQLLQFGKCNSPHLISGASLLLAALHLYLITHPDFKAQNVLCKIGNFYLKVKYIVWNCSGAFKIKATELGVEWSIQHPGCRPYLTRTYGILDDPDRLQVLSLAVSRPAHQSLLHSRLYNPFLTLGLYISKQGSDKT